MLDNTLHMQDQFWRNKVRNIWFKDRDRNTKFFHKTTELRYATDKITRFRNVNSFLDEGIGLDNHVINFYKILFSSQNNFSYNDLVERTIPQIITRVDNEYLTRIS